MKYRAVKWYKKIKRVLIVLLHDYRNQVLKMYITFKQSHTNAGYVKRGKGQGTRYLGWQWKDRKKEWTVKEKEESETVGRTAHWESHCWTGNRMKETDNEWERERERESIVNDTWNGVQQHTLCPQQPHRANTLLQQPARQTQANIQSLKETETQTDTSDVSEHITLCSLTNVLT